jgi:hypothetical protein
VAETAAEAPTAVAALKLPVTENKISDGHDGYNLTKVHCL